jgi:Rrf2 family protein
MMTTMPRTADYAIRAVVLLARHRGVRRLSAGEISSLVGAPRNYMSKTLNALVRHGLLSSMRGPGGGFALAIAPDLMTIGAIIRVFGVAGSGAARCLLTDRLCDATAPCSAHHRWMTITRAARAPLLGTTIGDLCGTDSSTSASNTG